MEDISDMLRVPRGVGVNPASLAWLRVLGVLWSDVRVEVGEDWRTAGLALEPQ